MLVQLSLKQAGGKFCLSTQHLRGGVQRNDVNLHKGVDPYTVQYRGGQCDQALPNDIRMLRLPIGLLSLTPHCCSPPEYVNFACLSNLVSQEK